MRCADSVVERKCGLIRGRWVDPNIVSIDTNTGINTSISIVLVSNISIGINARMIGRIFFVYPLSSAYNSLNCVKNVLFLKLKNIPQTSTVRNDKTFFWLSHIYYIYSLCHIKQQKMSQRDRHIYTPSLQKAQLQNAFKAVKFVFLY